MNVQENILAAINRAIDWINGELPPDRQLNPALEYASAADVDQLYEGLFQTFNKYTDHLPTKSRLHGYVRKSVDHRQPPRWPGPRRSMFPA